MFSHFPKKRVFLLTIYSLLIAGSMLGIIVLLTPDPPITEINQAAKALSLARSKKAHIYQKNTFEKAEHYYDSAMLVWNSENKRFAFFRNYQKVIVFAHKSEQLAYESKDNSIYKTTNLKQRLNRKINALKNETTKQHIMFSKLPLSENIMVDNSKGRFLLSEAEKAFQSEQYTSCNEKLTQSEKYLTSSTNHAMMVLNQYFDAYPEWKKNELKAIHLSEQTKSYSILVDKYARQCMIYLNGKKKYSFDVELGKNWIGKKNQKGDKATPEGFYQVKDKKTPPKTKYYKALLLDYPNEDDKKRFLLAKKNGILSHFAEIGGLVEIHGEGGKGIDWTDGCIALENNDMDILFGLLKTGTPVIIVGSLKPLETILN